MNESPKSKEKGIRLLKSAIQAKEQIIQKQQAKIQILQDTLFANQQTIRKLESTVAGQNQRSSDIVQKTQVLQTNCDHLETQIQFKKQTSEQAENELKKKLTDLSIAQTDHLNLQSQISQTQKEVKAATAKESELLAKVNELMNQKQHLELENAELRQYQTLAEEMHSQLELARLQIQQLESIYLKTQESLGTRENELIRLKNENEVLQSDLNNLKTSNKKFERQVTQLSSKAQSIAVTSGQLDEIQAQISLKDKEINSYRSKNRKLTEKISKMKEGKSDKTSKSQIKKLQSKLKHKEQELQQQQLILKTMKEQFQPYPNHQALNNQPFNNQPFNTQPFNTQPFNTQPFNSNQPNNNNCNGYQIPMEMTNLKEKYDKLKSKYDKIKKARTESLEEIYSLKLAAARLEDDLSSYEKIIASLKAEREDLKTKLCSAESFLNQYSKRMTTAERETHMLRDHMVTINANQDELATLQIENDQLRNRMDELEQDLILYTERQRRSVVRPKRPRKTAPKSQKY